MYCHHQNEKAPELVVCQSRYLAHPLCDRLTGGFRVNESHSLVVRTICVYGGNDVAVRVQYLPHGKEAIDIRVMQPEGRVESRNLRELHVTKSSDAVMDAVVDGLDVVCCQPFAAGPDA